LEAIKSSIQQISTQEVAVNIINEGVGDITESDINMAQATDALVVGFRVSIKPQVGKLAERKKVHVSLYEIIYQLIDDLFASLSNMLEPEQVEVILGKAAVLKIFRTTKTEQIVGARIDDGKLTKNSQVKIFRNNEEIGRATVTSLRRNMEEVETLLSGVECGIGLKTDTQVQEGDKLEAFQIEERIRHL
jgi:translation initiation factor IF-2